MFQQTQVVQHQNCQMFRMNIDEINTDQIKDEGLFASIMNNLQISQHDVENLSQKFKSETMVDFKAFLEMFYGIIKKQKNQEGEDQQYIYMKQNLIRLLIESLRLYKRKGGQISFEPSFDYFIQNEQQYNLSEQAQQILFQDSTVCEKLRDYVRNQFDNNRPDGDYDNKFFKLCWEDYAHYKQRMIDKIPWQRKDTTKFNKIYRWDTLYVKVIELILYSNQLSALNLHNRQMVQQSSFIYENNLYEIKEQIQQKQESLSQLTKQREFYQQRLIDIDRKYKELIEFEQNKLMEQSNHQIIKDESDKFKLTPKISDQIIENSLFNLEQIFNIPNKEFFYELQKWVEQMNQKQLQKLQEQEQNVYLYMKHNVFRIFIESLCIYINKGHTLNLEAIEKQISNGENFNYYNLECQLFQDEKICDKVNSYVRYEFLDNLPNDIQYVDFFQDVWEDIAYVKLKQFNQEIPYRTQKTNYHKIFVWDQVYQKFYQLVMDFYSKEDNILLVLSKQIELQNNNIKQQEIDQMYKQNQQQLLKESQNKHHSQQFQQEKIIKNESNNFQSSSSSLQQSKKINRKQKKAQKLIQNQEENLSEDELQKSSNSQLSNELQIEKLKVYFSRVPENQREYYSISILTDLIYTDLKNQKIELDSKLQDFYNFIDEGKQKSENFNCRIENFAELYQHQEGKKYLLDIIDNRYKHFISWNQKDFKILQQELHQLKIKIKSKSKR